MTLKLNLFTAASGMGLICGAAVAQADVPFWSTQARPAEEAQAVRQDVLSGFDGTVDYQPSEEGPWPTHLQGEAQAGKGSIGVLGALRGDFSALDPDGLADLGTIDATISRDTFAALAELGTETMQYVPWMQASYIMAANRQALDCLPEGADIDARLTTS